MILICPNCNEESPIGTKFCASCGTKLPDEVSVSEDSLVEPDGNNDNKKPVRSKKRKFIVLAGAIAVVAIALFIYNSTPVKIAMAEDMCTFSSQEKYSAALKRL
jgi:uncharacterized membrane protein YvbJ